MKLILPVTAVLTTAAFAVDNRPYEFVNAGRTTDEIVPWMDGGRAAISARISARERACLDFLFCIAYIIVYVYAKSKGKMWGVRIKLSVHP